MPPLDTDEQLLTAGTYDVLKHIPDAWWDELAAIDGLKAVTRRSTADIKRRLTELRKRGLIERRQLTTGVRPFELRRVAKDDRLV